jgi:hypothetical protein
MKLEALNVMVDLETLGKGSNACVLSIGAVVFTPHGVTDDKFYIRVDEESCVRAGLEIDASTVMWWLKQSDAARRELTARTGISIISALSAFTAWYPEGAVFWGNGATFDNVILSNAYKAIGFEKPWPYWGDRCYRTMKAMYPEVTADPFSGVAHNALDDAVHQANHLIKIANA